MRTYTNGGNFKAPEAFQYPQAKERYDPLGVDKTAFKYTHELAKRSRKGEKEDHLASGRQNKKNNLLGHYLSTDPAMVKYSSVYRIKNVNELKSLVKNGTD